MSDPAECPCDRWVVGKSVLCRRHSVGWVWCSTDAGELLKKHAPELVEQCSVLNAQYARRVHLYAVWVLQDTMGAAGFDTFTQARMQRLVKCLRNPEWNERALTAEVLGGALDPLVKATLEP